MAHAHDEARKPHGCDGVACEGGDARGSTLSKRPGAAAREGDEAAAGTGTHADLYGSDLTAAVLRALEGEAPPRDLPPSTLLAQGTASPAAWMEAARFCGARGPTCTCTCMPRRAAFCCAGTGNLRFPAAHMIALRL